MMNNFLQRMLKKNDDEQSDGEKVNLDNTKLKAKYCSESNKSLNWTKKLGISSPRKSDLTLRSPATPITVKPREYHNDYRQSKVPEPMTPKSTMNSEKTPSLERIRREFEMGFLSPTKQESRETKKSGRFVKKLVAAFEEKYKSFNDVKVETKQSSIGSKSSEDSSLDGEKTVADMMEESTVFLGDTSMIESLESRLSRYLDSYIAASSVRDDERRSDDEPRGDDDRASGNESSIDLGKCSFAMDEELRLTTTRNSLPKQEGTRESPETKTTKGTSEKSMSVPSSGNLTRTDSSIRRERKPKIIGAYLKKPIEIEDTSIDWIPITGKKLPRKRSFKRLLSILTGRKSSEKSSKLYCSEINLPEETTRELLQDSGYDEKSGSSSSLVSLVSINELLAQQKNRDLGTVEGDRRSFNMSTFRKTPASSFEQDICNENDYRDDFSSLNDNDVSDTCSMSSRTLLFEEVSRSELRLSLGPSFPSAAGIDDICSSDRRDGKSSTRNNSINDTIITDDDTPLASPLPKHPFVSMRRKFDDDNEDSHTLPDTMENTTGDMSFREFDKIEWPRNFKTWKFPTENDTITYDTPRRYLSKSEPGLASIVQRRNVDDEGRTIENAYDVPKQKISRRPRSSIYDDALSLKRRDDYFFNCRASSPDRFYGFPCYNQEPHYATVKPRNTKIFPSRELIRSVGDLSFNDPNCDDYFHDRVLDGISKY